MMTNDGVSRRDFLQTSIAGASALTLGVSGASKVLGANDEVVLGFIGAGGRGGRLLKGLLGIDGVRVSAICDLKQDRLDEKMEWASKWKPTGYLDFRKMLDKEKLHGVIVATEVGNHAKCVVPVLEAGLHCFSEKPMDCTVEKVDSIVKAARGSKANYQVGFQRRYNPVFRDAIAKIHNGEIGDVMFLQGHWHWEWRVERNWVLDVDMSGGEIVEQACHHMDVMSWVVKNQHPLCCAAMGTRKIPPIDQAEHLSEHHSAAIFSFPDGVNLSYTHLFYCPKQFTGEQLRVYGEHKGVDLRMGTFFTQENKDVPLDEKQPNWDAGTVEELESFVNDVCRDGKRALSNEDTGRTSTFISLMARKAMYNRNTKTFEPSFVRWEDLGSSLG
ncbi:MAG: Gfo/Idh/MocA family oxidoreductase [bacterium]